MTLKLDEEDHVDVSQGAVTGWVQLALVGGVMVGALVITSLMQSSGPEAPPQTAMATKPTVEVFEPSFGTTAIEVMETGVVELRSTVAVTPQVGGQVLSISPSFASGGAFEAGEVLFEIDPIDSRLEVQRLRADVESARRALELEEVEAAIAVREWEVVNPGEPVPSVVAREPQRAQAAAALDSAQARLDVAEVALSRTRVSLPFSGRVLDSTLEVGQTVSVNQSYGSAYALDALEVVLPLSQEDLARLDPVLGRNAEIVPRGAPDRGPIAATVVRVDSQLDPLTRQASIILRPEPGHGLLPGSFVEARLMSDGLSNTVTLPRSVVGAGNTVWVVESDTLAARAPRRLGMRGDALVFQAFDTGAGVVMLAPPGARDGLEVNPVDAPRMTIGATEPIE